jgi:hypothetical protein
LPFRTKDLQHLVIDLTRADGRVAEEGFRIQHRQVEAWSMLGRVNYKPLLLFFAKILRFRFTTFELEILDYRSYLYN